MRDADDTREIVKDFYGNAAQKPQENLCCPTAYHAEDTDHTVGQEGCAARAE